MADNLRTISLKFQGSNGPIYPRKTCFPLFNRQYLTVKNAFKTEYFPLTTIESQMMGNIRFRFNDKVWGLSKTLPNLVLIKYAYSYMIYAIENGQLEMILADTAYISNWGEPNIFYEYKTGYYFIVMSNSYNNKRRIGVSVDAVNIVWSEVDASLWLSGDMIFIYDEVYSCYRVFFVSQFYDYVNGTRVSKIRYGAAKFSVYDNLEIHDYTITLANTVINYPFSDYANISGSFKRRVSTPDYSALGYAIILYADNETIWFYATLSGNVSYIINPDSRFVIMEPKFDGVLAFPGRINSRENPRFVYDPYSDKIMGWDGQNNDILFIENYDGTDKQPNVNGGRSGWTERQPQLTFAGYGVPV
ncbi:hypothetical protein [uncultured Treponema sp.]|uniref:hypothetical protein n=1 Tax=uncultured Treponema sp. TaxID=162155 RepID=UPI0025F8FB00|nr:hypothetical protein [uncultured Treponema sp.]